MPADLLLAIDAGTSSTRAVLFDRQGHLVQRAAREVRGFYQPPRCEVHAGSLWQATTEAVQALNVNPDRIGAIAVTAALGMVLSDAAGAAVAPICTWQDRRADVQAARLLGEIGGDELYGITGRRCDPELTAPRLLWFREHAPDAFNRARYVFSLKDWLVFRLCGRAVTDATSASYSLLFDVVKAE